MDTRHMNRWSRQVRITPASRRRRALPGTLLLAGVLLGTGPEGHAADPAHADPQAAATQAGRDFRLYCADCHGADGRGRGPKTYDLAHPPPDLTTLAARHGGVFPREAVLRLIDGRTSLPAHGSREMPAWGGSLKLEAGEGLGGSAGEEQVVRDRLHGLVDLLEQWQR